MATPITNWTVTIFNPDGTQHANPLQVTLTAPGLNQSVTIPSQRYSCGYNHTLSGSQNGVSTMTGTGVNPWPDPGPEDEKSPEGGTVPSWDATGGQP